MSLGRKLKYTLFIVLASMAFTLSGVHAIFSSIATGSNFTLSITYSAPAMLQDAIQFRDYASNATSITFDYYNEEYNELIVNATSSRAVDVDSKGRIILYMVGTDAYVLSEEDIYANSSCYQMFYNLSKLTSIDFSNFNTSNVTSMAKMFYMWWI